MADDSRPWIKIEVTPRDLTSVSERDDPNLPSVLDITPHFTISNVGKSPAFNAQLHLWPWDSATEETDVRILQKERCGQARGFHSEISHDGQTLFPGQSMNELIYAGTGPAVVVVFGLSKKKPIQKNGKWPIALKAFGCVDYLFGSPLRHHQTGFIFSFFR